MTICRGKNSYSCLFKDENVLKNEVLEKTLGTYCSTFYALANNYHRAKYNLANAAKVDEVNIK